MTEKSTVYYRSEIGFLAITGTGQAVKSVLFCDSEPEAAPPDPAGLPEAVAACLAQLDEYFRGERQDFSLPLEPAGTPFQQTVWRQVAAVPYGQTVSYLDVARGLGNEKAVRAVGHANGQNPLVIIVPCHRVIGRGGQLTGYGGGLWRKAWLLNHERQFSGGQLALF